MLYYGAMKHWTSQTTESFCHSTIRRILNITWQQVRNERAKNKQARFCYCNIPKIKSFVNKRTATYVRKNVRSNDDELPKKFLGSWINQPRKTGGQQLSCINNFMRVIIPINQKRDKGSCSRSGSPLQYDMEWLSYIDTCLESCCQITDKDENSAKNQK